MNFSWRSFLHGLTSIGENRESTVRRVAGQEMLLLLRYFLFHPFLKIFLRHHVKVRLHVVMPKTAQLGTENFVLAWLGSGEMNGQVQSGNKILLETKFADIERVAHILGVHQQVDFTIHWNG